MVEFFTMEKVVNPTVPKNNLFHEFYSITTFEVVFSHPLGLTERELACTNPQFNTISSKDAKKEGQSVSIRRGKEDHRERKEATLRKSLRNTFREMMYFFVTISQ